MKGWMDEGGERMDEWMDGRIDGEGMNGWMKVMNEMSEEWMGG